jgi:hypothetical protein
VGWDKDHIHAWVIYTDIKMLVQVDEDHDTPFCAWICRCGAWKWRLSPEAMYSEEYTEI